jgi:hypothetical protein
MLLHKETYFYFNNIFFRKILLNIIHFILLKINLILNLLSKEAIQLIIILLNSNFTNKNYSKIIKKSITKKETN